MRMLVGRNPHKRIEVYRRGKSETDDYQLYQALSHLEYAETEIALNYCLIQHHRTDRFLSPARQSSHAQSLISNVGPVKLHHLH